MRREGRCWDEMLNSQAKYVLIKQTIYIDIIDRYTKIQAISCRPPGQPCTRQQSLAFLGGEPSLADKNAVVEFLIVCITGLWSIVS